MPSLFRPLVALGLGLLAIAGPAAAETRPAPHAEPRKVIIDDDGFALMQAMLLKAPDVEVLGITTVSGDFWQNRATAMALRGLELVDRKEVPVSAGATFPLVNSEALTDRWEALYGKLTWRGAWMHHWVEPTEQAEPEYHGPFDPVHLAWGDARLKPTGETAAAFLIRMVHKYPHQITIVACGPMTNLALAQKLDPEFAGLTKELLYMGGSLNPHQVLEGRAASDFAREFANSPRREFNFRFDPEAASIMSHSPFPKITAVPVDPSTATQLSPAFIARLKASAPAAMQPLFASLAPGFPLWDEIVAAVWLDPSLEKDGEDLYLDADTQFGPAYGDMLSWREHYQPGLGEQKAHVVRSIDVPRFEALITQLVGRR
ncbi:MAG TPA: nucleoside hydrolase [Novosphingobium sp.]|nr:nucleoside hydrolase [Novosphingobium sp.]HZV08879.1 nucleoside hydrolase [Novosphingobium sp.]